MLFQVQPLIGRYILPWFGGYAGVWSVMMVFFQTVLLLGYCYAHVLCTRLRPRTQAVVHILMLCAALALLPIVPSPEFKPDAGIEPISRILVLLLATLGLPYFVVSTTGPLVQAWFARSFPGRSPYVLYALSNVGSLLALLGYPFVVEPLLGRFDQAMTWSAGFAVFTVCCAGVALVSLRPATEPRGNARGKRKRMDAVDPPAEKSNPVLWVCLSCLASMLLLAFTNELCVDVASVPFLWVLPLCCYLLSFIFTFAGYRIFRGRLWHVLSFLALVGIASITFSNGRLGLHILAIIFIYTASLFVLCCGLHGELYRLRPAPERLTSFYLSISVGGSLGGVIVGIAAPLFFKGYFEMYIALVLSFILLSWSFYEKYDSYAVVFFKRKVIKYALLSANIAYAMYFVVGFNVMTQGYIHMERNFYGTFVVAESNIGEDNAGRAFYSGTTVHGVQYLKPEYRKIPTGYFTPYSGVGVTLGAVRTPGRKVGIVGLGAGTLAAYGRPGDHFKFYEINPASQRIAEEYFTFLEDSEARVEIKLGDGRLSLEREESQGFDVIVLDAFTSDSIPMHLLTLEAFETYLRHLKPDGVICVNISNRHVDMKPVLKMISELNRVYAYHWSAGVSRGFSGLGSDFIVMSRGLDFIRDFNRQADYVRARYTPEGRHPDTVARGSSLQSARDIRPWTDDFSNLFAVIKPMSF